MDYLGRCFSALDDKPALTDEEKKEFLRVLRNLQKINKELADLWTEEERATPLTEVEIAADMEKAHSEGRSYFPFEDEKLGKQVQANNVCNMLNGLGVELSSLRSASSIPETSKNQPIAHLESEIQRLGQILANLEEEGIKPNLDAFRRPQRHEPG